MLFTKTVLTGALLAVLAATAQATNLDRTYESPIFSGASVTRQTESKPRFPMKNTAPVTVKNDCTGPLCSYETDISLPREDPTTQSISIDVNL